jgi:hypothetical protein
MKFILVFFLMVQPFILTCQSQNTSVVETSTQRVQVGIETRVSNYFQQGYDVKLLYYPSDSHFSYGISIGGLNVTGNVKDWVYEGKNVGLLDIRLIWAASFLTRYHFKKNRKQFFIELAGGIEEFRVKYQEVPRYSNNAFISPSAGFYWFPFKFGLYAMPKLSANFLFFRDSEKTISEINYQLRFLHLSPSIAMGWKF